VLTIGQFYVERYYARGTARALPPTPFQRLRQDVFRVRPQPEPALGDAPWATDPPPQPPPHHEEAR
jgi:hypothetical protein